MKRRRGRKAGSKGWIKGNQRRHPPFLGRRKVEDMDVNEPETGGSADSLRSGLRIAIFSLSGLCWAWLAAERGRGGSERQSNFLELLQG